MKAVDIRDKFVNFFQNEDHQYIESSPLPPQDDPTLLFANAGMNQFKDYFTGKVKPKNKRAVSIQKCVRAGGKHNDLENVGFTARHHTFFEMLGNFSFGDYFKEDAIRFAWDFLTKELNIPKDKLLISIHHSDDEAKEIWHKKMGVPLSRIFKRDDKENFWEMGDVGPCGPSSEIFYDHSQKYSKPPKNMQCPLDDEGRYVEIWNLVFMQYEKKADATMVKLPQPSVDTGAGLERLAAVLQKKYWNYDTDLFAPIIKKIENLSSKQYQDGQYSSSMRVVADHARSATMLITDGVLPSNEGRGYVLRRIIRRAVRHLNELGINRSSMAELVDVVFDILGSVYPQNLSNKDLAKKLLTTEENKFRETLSQGLKLLDEYIKEVPQNHTLGGELCFKLYDTYGFPPDLTELILNEKNRVFDHDGFAKAMEQQKQNSRESNKFSYQENQKEVFQKISEQFGTTPFFGYEGSQLQAKLLHIENINEQKIAIFNKTPFYPESGGQVADTGTITLEEQTLAHVQDTQTPIKGLIIHIIDQSEQLKIGQTYVLKIDQKRRELIKRNHSATHLLQAALIKVLGAHIKQAGSLVSDDKLRFDFTHPESLSKEQLRHVERLVNEQIQQSLDTHAREMSKDEALKEGAMAIFGEKYGQDVRTIKMGKFSFELCGGTHVCNTKEIEYFKITSETSLSSGVRRIEAITSKKCLEYLSHRSEILEKIELLLGQKNDDLPQRVETLLVDLKKKNREISNLKSKITNQKTKNIFNNITKLKNEIDFVISKTTVNNPRELRTLSDDFVNKFPKGVLFLYMDSEEKINFVMRTHKNNTHLPLANFIKNNIQLINGRGGGRNDLIQGSGYTENLDHFIEKLKNEISNIGAK